MRFLVGAVKISKHIGEESNAKQRKAAMLLGASGCGQTVDTDMQGRGPFPHAQMKAGEDAAVSEAWTGKHESVVCFVRFVCQCRLVLYVSFVS